MREVDEAVRTDEVTGAFRNYGLPVGIVLVLGLAAFGGWLWWDGQREAALEEQSEIVVLAMDELDAGNLDQADQELATVDGDASPAALASANLFRANIALEQGRLDDAVGLYEQVIASADTPQPMRDAALVRMVYANFDNMPPQDVIDRLGPMAVEGNAWFGGAGELVFHAYLEMENIEQAGALATEMTQSDLVPETLKARIRQLAGRYGFDTIDEAELLLNGEPVEDEDNADDAEGEAE